MNYVEQGVSPTDKEPTDWTPVLTLKPHHAIQNGGVKRTLSGEKFKRPPFLSQIIEQRLNLGGYSRDIVGTNVRGILDNSRKEEDFLRRLAEVPDDAVVQLDLAPDDLCRACVVGKHCMATNYRVGFGFSPATNYADAEQLNVARIQLALDSKGYQEGRDFVFRPTEHVLFDYGGGSFKSTIKPQPVEASFNAILLKMGALRTIVQDVAAQ